MISTITDTKSTSKLVGETIDELNNAKLKKYSSLNFHQNTTQVDDTQKNISNNNKPSASLNALKELNSASTTSSFIGRSDMNSVTGLINHIDLDGKETRKKIIKKNMTAHDESDTIGGSCTPNFNSIVSCLRNFHIDTSNRSEFLLVDTLRNYTLGQKDVLTCSLCCVDEFDLSGFLTNHTRGTDTKKTNANKGSKNAPFCNQENLKKIALYVHAFNPFCDEYCEAFYPNSDSQKKPNRKKCLPCSLPKKSTLLTNNNNFNNNTSRQSSSSQQFQLLNKAPNNERKIESLIDCLKGFDYTIGNNSQKLNEYNYMETAPTTIINNNNNKINSNSLITTTTTTATTKNNNNSYYSLLRFKKMPITCDDDGNLIANINIPEKLSKKSHNISSTLMSKSITKTINIQTD